MPDPGGRASVTGTDALLRLATGVPSDRIVTDPAVLIDRSHDWSPPGLLGGAAAAGGLPLAVVLPSTTDEVAAAMSWASQNGVAVVPRGGGSGVCGGAQAPPGTVVLDLS